jgi:hypothetical protein
MTVESGGVKLPREQMGGSPVVVYGSLLLNETLSWLLRAAATVEEGAAELPVMKVAPVIFFFLSFIRDEKL